MGSKFKVLGLQILRKLSLGDKMSLMIIVLFLSHDLRAVTANPSERPKIDPGYQSNSTQSNLTTNGVNQDSIHKIFPSDIHQNPLNYSIESVESVEDPEEMLRKALINHTLTHGGEGDLDKLIFSSIPEGSKLTVQTVKVMRTDEHGNQIPGSKTKDPVHWDVSLSNATDIVDEYEDDDEDEDEENQEDDKGTTAGRDSSDTDLAIAGSHAQANYKTYGNSAREKEKNNKYYHGNDHGKTHKVTHTDTDGVKDTNYKGKEKGLTDFAHADGNSLNKESERFRDTKRKNKGRRVSGFKRVYHKEEFQRTEHFFDDEEAKRIAESHGLKDSKEQSNHGTKGDDRKYHGTRKEYTDGKKVKNEHGTSNGYNKGQLTEYKDSEKHKERSHYDKSQHSPNYNNNGHYHLQQQQKQHHPNHNYHGSYSQPRKTIRRPNYSSTSNDNNVLVVTSDDIVGSVAKAPMIASFTMIPYSHDSSTSSSTDDSTVLAPSQTSSIDHTNDSSLTLTGPNEKRTFFSPRERPRPPSPEYLEPPTYASNFRPDHTRGQRHHMFYLPQLRNPNLRHGYPLTPFRNKIGNASLADEEELRNNYTKYYRNNNGSYDRERYARKYPSSTVRNTLFGSPPGPGYSTLVKVMPVNYINLTDESGNENDSRQQSVNSNQIVLSPESRHNLSNYRSIKGITFTTSTPLLIRRPPPPRGNWISITIGNPDPMTLDEHRHPNHNYVGYSGIRPLTSLVRGVKNKLMQPILRSPYLSGNRNRFDPSKYPPNVIQSNVNSFSTVPQTASTQKVNQNSNNLHQTDLNRPVSGQSGVLNNYQAPYQNSNGNPSYSYKGGHRPRTPHSLPPFMNNLMDSVANFFSRMSNKETG